MSKHKHLHHDYHHDYHLVEPLHDLDLDDDEIEGKKKKPWVIFGSVIIILLMLSFLLPLERIGSIVESKKMSSNYLVELDGGKKILFESSVYEAVRDTYTSSKTEIKMCLSGSFSNNVYLIDSYYFPKIFASDYDSVTSEMCNNNTLISLHSHPGEWCIFSAQDIKSYKILNEINKNAFIGLICGVDTFNFHGY